MVLTPKHATQKIMYKIIGADGKEYGPVSLAQLQQWIAEGRANHQSKVRREDETEWKTVAELSELSGAGLPPLPTTPTQTVAQNVPNYLWQSIVITLCCCIPFGVVAIVYAAQVRTKLNVGDFAGAQDASNKARMWCWVGFIVGILTNVIGGVVQFMAMRAASGN